MKTVLFIMVLTLLAVTPAQAQKGFNINALLNGRFKHSPHATEIVVTGSKAAKIGLDVYHSLSMTDMALTPIIMKAVKADGVKATTKEVEYRGGSLYYGFYVFTSPKGYNRFVFYLDQSLARKQPVSKVTLIYMAGNVSSDYIKKLIRQ